MQNVVLEPKRLDLGTRRCVEVALLQCVGDGGIGKSVGKDHGEAAEAIHALVVKGMALSGLGEKWHKIYDVICENVDCICHPDCPKVFADKEEAIEAWNRRVGNESHG